MWRCGDGQGHLRLVVSNVWESLGRGSTVVWVTSMCHCSPEFTQNQWITEEIKEGIKTT